MQPVLFEYITLTIIILALVMLANKIKLAYPIVLVLGGLALSFFRQFSSIEIDPEMIFFFFLPPLLYEAAWQTSWKAFYKWRRVITSFAFPIVIITSCVIAIFSNWLIPEFTLALGFLLGGIISPPDAISATSIMRRVNAPKALVNIIEGESLLNDASSLIVFRFALIAIVTGQFHLTTALGTFFLVVVLGVVIGLVVALLFYVVHRWLPVTPSIEIVLTLITPYCMYYSAEHFHYSGVLAVVAGGLFLSYRRQTILTYETRLQGVNVWSNFTFVLNGFVFMLIGLQLPAITSSLGDTSFKTALFYGLAISVVLIVLRLFCTFGAMIWTVLISRFITVADNRVGWKMPLIAGWTGMRGVVSLGAALSIPLMLPDGSAFPERNLILFITFVVILVTLVLQGLTLPWLIRVVKPNNNQGLTEEEQEVIIQKKMALSALKYLESTYNEELYKNDYLANLRSRLQMDITYFENELVISEQNETKDLNNYHKIFLELVDQRRVLLEEMNRREEFDEEIIRRFLNLLDLEEVRLRELIKS